MNKVNARKLYKNIRSSFSLSEKKYYDNCIFIRLINSQEFKSSDLILTYVSFNNEVDTIELIDYCLSNSKRVAVPVCFDNKSMLFYEIENFSELFKGKYGILSVDISNKKPVENFSNSLCIVPAFTFDVYGNRIGYGGGFYDRFLEKKKIKTIGLCFERNFCLNKINSDSFDIPVDYIITENNLRISKIKEVADNE